MKKHIEILAILLVALLMTHCSEETMKPIESDGTLTGPVTDISVTPLPGGAIITYKLPDDAGLKYVEASLATPNGVKLFNSSSYSSAIKIEGLGSSSPQEIKLYTVNNSEQKSEPINITIEPLTPPFLEVFNSVNLEATFSGIRLKYINDKGADISYYLGYIDERGEFVEYDSFSSNDADRSIHVFRGLDNSEKNFAFYLKDRWNHYSDTIYTKLTPLYETEIVNKDEWKHYLLNEDGPFIQPGEADYNNVKIEYLWDGIWSEDFSNPYLAGTAYAYKAFAFGKNSYDPLSLTIDLGAEFYLNRFLARPYWRYSTNAPRKWEVWGSLETPPVDATWEWDGWILLANMENEKPSGLAGNEVFGPGDEEQWLAGISGDIMVDSPIRYIRIKSLLDWRGFCNFSIAEIQLFGEKANK